MSVAETVEVLLDDEFDLPDPGGGRTAERHRALFDIARRHPVSVARIVEAHTDAVAILRAADRAPVPGAVYGVWASAGSSDDTRFERCCSVTTEWSSPHAVITGTKPFASGLGIVTRALVTVAGPTNGDTAHAGGRLLIDVDVSSRSSIITDLAAWSTPALADSSTGSVRFDGHRVDGSDVIGAAGWYLERVGFWHGACGPAACWAGAAAGLADAAERMVDADPHRRAHLGAMRSDVWALQAMLDVAGREIDDDPEDCRRARDRALALRHQVERRSTDILDRFGRALGPRPFVRDAEVNQRWLDLHLYLRQDHAERDLAVLGEPHETPGAVDADV